MVTVSHIVTKMIEQKPFIQEGLSRGIINHAALADELLPKIEKELKKKVKFSAVNMAIRRLAEKLEHSVMAKAKFDKTSDITIKSDLIEITIYKVDEKYIKKLYDIVDIKKGDFLTITQGLNEIMFITNAKHKKNILNLFKKSMIKKVVGNLASLTIKIPEESIQTRGLFYLITRALAWENINIIDIVSTFTEMTVIVDEDDTARGFDTLKELIRRNC